MSDIRVTYSGLFLFMSGIISIFTGLVFVLIITRNLSPEEFGTWNLFNGLIFYVSLIQPLVSYWLIRETARNQSTEKTGILFSSVFSIMGICIFLGGAIITTEQTDVVWDNLFYGIFLIPLIFLNDVLIHINMGFKPENASIGKLSLEISKIPCIVILVNFLNYDVIGVIFSLIIAQIPSILILSFLARKRFSNPIKLEYVKKWLKLSWISLYPGVNTLFRYLDVLIFSLITGSVVGLSYYGAAWSISALVLHSNLIAGGVYAKLLSDKNSNYLRDTITKMVFFAVLLSSISLTFAKPGLYALNPIYEIALPLVLIFTPRFILESFNRAFENFLFGIEEVDVKNNSKFKNFIHSKLFVIPTFRLIQNIIYSIILVIILILLPSLSDLDLLIYWGLLGLITTIPITIYLTFLVISNFKIKFDYLSTSKYILTSFIVFTPISFIINEFLEYKENIFEFLPNLLIFVILGTSIYLLITYMIDYKTRLFINAILKGILH